MLYSLWEYGWYGIEKAEKDGTVNRKLDRAGRVHRGPLDIRLRRNYRRIWIKLRLE